MAKATTATPTRSSKRRKIEQEVKAESQSTSNNLKPKVEDEQDRVQAKVEDGETALKAEDGDQDEVKMEVDTAADARVKDEEEGRGRVKEEDASGEVIPKIESETKSAVKEETVQANEDAAEVDDVKPTSTDDKPTQTRRSGRSTKTKPEPKVELDVKDQIDQLDQDVAEVIQNAPTATTAKSASKNKYNLTPGQTPFPDYPHPTREECQTVIDLLSTVHEKPERTMTPSVTVPGCGEVPAVLDSLMRTMLSAATTTANSSRAFQNIVTTYGLLTEGIGKGSVDWDKVRLGTQQELFVAIQCGGLAQNKSKNIKAVLDMVHQENQERRESILLAGKGEKADSDLPPGIKEESERAKTDEVKLADEGVLSLNHLHSLSTDEAMSRLTSYPGVGVKTASCVLLFNFGRGSFAVDTHVWRLCRWLGWVPNHASRNQTYSHCEVRIPDEMKYDLHGLFWKHGKYW